MPVGQSIVRGLGLIYQPILKPRYILQSYLEPASQEEASAGRATCRRWLAETALVAAGPSVSGSVLLQLDADV